MLLLCVLPLVAAGCTSGKAETPTPGTVRVASRVLDLRDATRPTPASADGTTPAEPGRVLPTELRYPERGRGPYPVVVFSHGFDSKPAEYGDLLGAWAQAGFVVAAPTFPRTSRGSAGPIADVANQPADVSFVLTQVLALNSTPGDDLEGRIDTEHVAVAGHSAGAITALAMLSDCCADPRVDAAVLLAATGAGMPWQFVAPGVPTLFVHGSADETIPEAAGRALYDTAPSGKAFLELLGGSHSEPYKSSADRRHSVVVAVTTDFLRWTLKRDSAALARFPTDGEEPGLARLTVDGFGP